ncbi:MAG: hypothetical protein JO048_09550, partial [Methylobacteriaceae bacterium]|nr:hypothetical protein [Methylobacteriaceae bacterium]
PTGWTGQAEFDVAAPERDLDPRACGDLLADRVSAEPIGFQPGRAELTAAGAKAVASLRAVLIRCQARGLSLALRPDSPSGADETLARGRAATIASALADARSDLRVQPGLAPAGGGPALRLEVQP